MTDKQLQELWEELRRVTGIDQADDDGYGLAVGSIAGRYSAEIKRQRAMIEHLRKKTEELTKYLDATKGMADMAVREADCLKEALRIISLVGRAPSLPEGYYYNGVFHEECVNIAKAWLEGME